ncbi:MAG: helix-turn-helix transcriptional regulator, partial [Bacteroidota bacterium]
LVQDYLRGGEYSIKYSFANQLKEYMTLTRRSQKKLGGELNIEKTKLNKLLSGKVNPSMDICYRLEKHSDNILPALLWYDLHLKQLAYEASSNDAIRVAAYQQVTGGLFLKQTS